MTTKICFDIINTMEHREQTFERDQTTGKLILLWVMEKMEIPLTENSILDICTSKNNWLNYMECKELMWELLNSGFLYKTEEAENEERYTITYEGRNCLSHFYKRIPLSMREKITDYVKLNRMNVKRSQEYLSDYTKNSDGSFTVSLRIRSQLVNQPMFELKIKAPSRNSAMNACKKWQELAPSVYENICETLIDE